MATCVYDYHDRKRYWQDRFDTRRLADRSAGRLREHIDAPAREFIEGADLFLLATCDHRGLPTCSYTGGDPGFVRVVDASWLAFPNYDGNGKYRSRGNLLKNPSVGMLFMDFEQGRRLRLQGLATIQEPDELLTTYPGVQLIVRVQVTEVYNNCPRYIHQYQRVERSPYVPRGDHEPPIPAWKLRVETPDLLPAHDPVRTVVGGTSAHESSTR